MKVGAVVVCYFPNEGELHTNLLAVRDQVSWIILVNNGDERVNSDLVDEEIFFAENRGVAVAQNSGIERVQALGADAVLLLDQDSQLYGHAVETLVRALATDRNLAAVGPTYRELHSNQVNSFFRVGRFFRTRLPAENLLPGEILNVDFLISSGSLINLAHWSKIGGMREDFVVDFVDTDWCIRATNLGFALGAVGSVQMQHSMGEGVERIWFGKWWLVRKDRPERYYFFFKNGMKLLLGSATPMRWRFVLLKTLVARLILLPMLARKGIKAAARNSLAGLASGLR